MSAASPSRKRFSPAAKWTLPAQPASSASLPGSSPSRNGTSARTLSSDRGTVSLRRADCRDLLGDVDPDRAPGDAAAAADAPRRAELVEPGAELVRHPLPVARAPRRADAAAVNVRV